MVKLNFKLVNPLRSSSIQDKPIVQAPSISGKKQGVWKWEAYKFKVKRISILSTPLRMQQLLLSINLDELVFFRHN